MSKRKLTGLVPFAGYQRPCVPTGYLGPNGIGPQGAEAVVHRDTGRGVGFREVPTQEDDIFDEPDVSDLLREWGAIE